jgi:ribonuclease-3 family protein
MEDFYTFKKVYTKAELAQMPPLTLAYIGDAVYEVFIRERLIAAGGRSVNTLHRSAINFVKCNAQSRIIKYLIQFLTDEEKAIYKRGRNANTHTVPKNADICEYRQATGFEALVGHLFLLGDSGRLDFLLGESYKFIAGGV